MNEPTIVPIKDAMRLWRRDRKTLIKWAESGQLLYDKLAAPGSKRVAWYIETPDARQARVFNQ